MQTEADLQNEGTESKEEDINPRTGMPYKTSAAVRKSKAKWRNAHAEEAKKATYRWIDNNRERWNEVCRNNMRIRNQEFKYLRELFSEGLVNEPVV